MSKRKVYEEVFDDGFAPLPSQLCINGSTAEWEVTMLTGIIPNMGRAPFNHRKRIANSAWNITGCNVLFGNCRWGSFDAYTAFMPSASGLTYGGGPALLIDYGVPSNSFITRRIRDWVRTTSDPNVMIGKFTYKIFGKYCTLGYFKLTRKEI